MVDLTHNSSGPTIIKCIIIIIIEMNIPDIFAVESVLARIA